MNYYTQELGYPVIQTQCSAAYFIPTLTTNRAILALKFSSRSEPVALFGAHSYKF